LSRQAERVFVPGIPAADLNCAFYLYPSEDAAKAGLKLGGSGFWVGVQSLVIPHFWWLYAVSNRHVVHRNGASVIRANSVDGGVRIINAEPTDWIEHPNGHDIAVLPVAPPDGDGIELASILTGMFVEENDVKLHAVEVGNEVFMIGRFINHEGKARNTPSARFGNISMLPGEPIYVDATTPPQESFAVELRSMCGYSGSPVFVTAESPVRHFANSVRDREYLLGVHWGHIVEPWTVETKIIKKAMATALTADEVEVNQVSANTGMNGVVPAWRLKELIDLPRFKKIRDADEQDGLDRIKREAPGAVLDAATAPQVSPPSNDANPKHREDFRRLVDAAARKRK
jgi:Trypsin-like peptidase domain